jgi:hypothetical protein
MVERMIRSFVIVILAVVLTYGQASAQESFFKGKTVRIVVGSRLAAASIPIRERWRAIGAGIFPAIRRSWSKTWPEPAA